MENLKNEVFKNMRSCMISTKERLSVRQLYNDYRTIIGDCIPYQRLGYKNLEDLVRSAPQQFVVTNSGNDYFVAARESEKSAHITEMVAKQKTAKRRPPPRVRFSRNAPPPRMQHMSKWRPKSNTPNKYESSKRPQAVNHAQFLYRGPTLVYTAPSVASKVVIPENSTLNSKPQQTVAVPPAIKNDMNQRLTSNRLKENMRALSSNGSVNGTASVINSNGTSHLSNRPSSLSNNQPQKYVQEPTMIKDKSLNPLVSTKQRLAKKMSELSLDSDSGTSSPTGEILPPSPSEIITPPLSIEISAPYISQILPPLRSKTPDFVRTGDALVDLKNLAKLHKLGEVKVNTTQIGVKKNKTYSCLIKVGSKYSYGSYPKDFWNPLEAQTFCCETALNELIPQFKRKSLMIANDRDILDRIPPMLEKHANGIWASQLKLDYSDKYKELLPDDWLKIIDASPVVQIEKSTMAEDYILCHCAPGDKGQRRSVAVPVSNVSVPSNTIRSGEDGRLHAHVTCAMSASEIWCQQTGDQESELYSNMLDRMQIYYQEHEFQLKPKDILMAGYYIAKYEDEYFRVRAVKISELEVDCFFIDCGDELSIPKSDIFEFKREYASVQAQAFVCRLYGLEELYEVSQHSEALASLLEAPVVIEIAGDVANNGHLNDALPVVLYDFETGQSINEVLISKLTIELASPTLQQDGITEVYVSNIESNGDVYVQVRSRNYENWMKLKRQIEKEMSVKPPRDVLCTVTRSNSNEKLYFFEQMDDLLQVSWNRIKLIDWSPDEMLAQIYFVDEGHAQVIPVAQKDLYPLEAVNDIFNNYPYQAVRVRMSLKEIPPNFKESASRLMPSDQPVLLKIEGTTEDNFPLVKMFKRSSDDAMFCINTSIDLETEMKREENNNMKSKFKSGNGCVPSTGTLKCPPLPIIGVEDQYFEVYIPMAITPYNFFVQPFASRGKLNEMMGKLQTRYHDVESGTLKISEVRIGCIYASKFDDGCWYRTNVIKVLHSGSISVFYCDFGYYQTLSVKQLIPLDQEFLELPYQALKAKLKGIKPAQDNWTMEDCEHFKEMIERKPLQAMVVNIEKDDFHESDLVLQIKNLIDTTSDDADIYMEKELVELGIAVEEEPEEVI